jgi:hypothetical protein
MAVKASVKLTIVSAAKICALSLEVNSETARVSDRSTLTYESTCNVVTFVGAQPK